MFRRLQAASLMSEFLGTAMLVMVAIVLTETTAVSYFIATSLALTLGVVVMLFGAISGAHVNPAITFGMWAARRITSLRAVGYVAAQMLGGLTAWQLYQYLADKDLPAKTATFSTELWLAEAVGTFVLALGVSAAVVRGLSALESAFAYGASIFVGIMIASVGSAGLLNPAMALGLRGWGTAYVLGPLVGGLVGVTLYNFLFTPGSASAAVRRVTTVTRVSRTKVTRK